VTPDDARRALTIYGSDIAALKGRTKKSFPAPRVPTFQAVPLPAPILLHHRNVSLCIDLFYVQGHAFFHSISRDIGFRTVCDRKQATIWRELLAAKHLYSAWGLRVLDVHCNNEFECLRDNLVRPIVLNVVTMDSHVGEVRRMVSHTNALPTSYPTP
jgi:hypothetical protein